VGVGSPKEYARWVARAREYLRELRQDPDQLDYVDARFGYRANRITLLHLQDPGRELSVADTLSHEVLHSLLDQIGESFAARTIDVVCKPVGHPQRRGGI
jgi:hypothetical protein